MVLDPERLERLTTHVAHITHSLICKIGPEGIIKSQYLESGRKVVAPDLPASHHLVSLLHAIDGRMFSCHIRSILRWFVDAEHGVLDSPFALDSLSLAWGESDKFMEFIDSTLAKTQLADGSFTKFTGHVDGGDYFSTLWSTKILVNYSSKVFGEAIKKATRYLLDRRTIAATRPSLLGFLGYVLLKCSPHESREEIDEVFREVKAQAERIRVELEGPLEEEPAVLLLIDFIYLIEDLLEYHAVRGDEQVRVLCESCCDSVFDLKKPAEGLPQLFSKVAKKYNESLLLHTMARSCLIGHGVAVANGYSDLKYDINSLVHSNYRDTQFDALVTKAQLAEFLQLYGDIHHRFEQYNDKLTKAWENSLFEDSVFLMMPFTNTHSFRSLACAIKASCKRAGFRAIRVDDEDRRFAETLWDNLIINMLSCKYAIAVYVSEATVDRLKGDEVRLFPNPNVALEFGFFTSRGQEILMFKEKDSPVPTDLQGFLWSEFTMDEPETSVQEPLKRWLNRLRDKDQRKGGD